MILASWTPRPPSRRLRHRLFPLRAEKESGEPGLQLSWLAPVSVAFVATFLAIGQSPSALPFPTLFSKAIMEPGLASYLGTHSPHNSFDSTLGLGDVSLSSTTPPASLSTHVSLLGTNTVRP